MTSRCPDCAQALDHCHGDLVVHASGRPECTDPACVELDVPRHRNVVGCDALGCTCTDAT